MAAFFAACNFSRIFTDLIVLHPEPGSVRGGVASDLFFKKTKRGKVFLKNTCGDENYELLLTQEACYWECGKLSHQQGWRYESAATD